MVVFMIAKDIERRIKMKPICKLIGEDGNIFNLINIVSKVLKQNNLHDETKEMTNRIFNSRSYNEALIIISEYVEIE